MGRRAVIAAWIALLALLPSVSGCTWPGARREIPQAPPSPAKAARIQAISERAQAAVDRNDLEQARLELLQLIAETPHSAEAQYRLGKVLQLQGRLNEASACFHQALEIDPDYVVALVGLGNIEMARGDYPLALKRFETAIEVEPHEVEAQYALATVLEALGRTDDALAAFFRTLELDPLHPHVSFRIGSIQLARNQTEQALARLDQAVDLAPEDGEVRLLRGQAHLALGHAPQAISDLRVAAARLSGRADVHYRLAMALDAAHQRADAIRAADEALRLAPDYADARDLSQRLRR